MKNSNCVEGAAMSDKGERQAVIFDIQAFSVHDGPGCRTNVFFAGCPLRCRWCANPENFAARPHLMFSAPVCKWKNGCRACQTTCSKGGLTFDAEKGPVVNWDICNRCTTFECAEYCAARALKVCGKTYTVRELMKILRRDFNNWGSDGGVTFTGGEPLLQYDFLLETLKLCHREQIHTAVETSACVNTEHFLQLMQYIDFAFIDVKNMDDEKHKWGTGVSNEKTLSNIRALKKSGWPGRLVLRYPVIAGFNDSGENALRTIAFMKENGIAEINLLKFHRLGQTKWEQLGMKYEYATGGNVPLEQMEKLQDLYLDNDILCYLGDKTPF
ncbi:MAG: 4-hydroxyphenylacetate decarboxylase activase [Acidaminococcaceae bacterium]|nr:4-hydroxyphenylacetate decarboxylase activase [Acidaminococcaceae bacterium]